jgi:flagellar protein FliS
MLPNPYQQYKEQSLNTMSSGEILVKLFDECVKQLNIGQRAILAKDYAKTNDSLSKTQEIIDTLSISLDMNYEISQQLRPMYTFLSQRVMQANMKKDAAIIAEVLPLLKELRGSFDEAQKLSRRPQYSAVGGRAI